MSYRVLITGLSGFIGGHLAERLLTREDVTVRGLARSPQAVEWLGRQGAEIVAGDLLDPPSLASALEGCNAVLHAAAWTGGSGLDQREAWATNVTATQELLQAAQANNVQRFIFFSSVAVYGLNRSPLIDESAPTPPVGQLYPDSKIAAEALVHRAQAQGLPTTIIRPASTYGPRGSAWTVGPIRSIQAGHLVLLGEDRGLVNTGYIDNVVDGTLLALDSPRALGQTFNLCDGSAVTYRQFYQRYARMVGVESLPTIPAWTARLGTSAPGRLLRRLLGRPEIGPWSRHFRFNPSHFSIERARRLLGYQPRISFDEGMRRTEAWLQEAGYLTSPVPS